MVERMDLQDVFKEQADAKQEDISEVFVCK
jgi:hypothetical protein